MRDTDSSPRSADLPPGYDEDDPYEDDDLSTYPTWWRRCIEEFRDHGLRPYRPPRFSDDAYVPVVIESLESELGVEIRVRAINPQDGNEWDFLVDGEPVISSVHRREEQGFSRYLLSSDAFRAAVRDSL